MRIRNNYLSSQLPPASLALVLALSHHDLASDFFTLPDLASVEIPEIVHLQVYSFLQDVKEIKPKAATASTNFFMFLFVLKLKDAQY